MIEIPSLKTLENEFIHTTESQLVSLHVEKLADN